MTEDVRFLMDELSAANAEIVELRDRLEHAERKLNAEWPYDVGAPCAECGHVDWREAPSQERLA